MSKMLSRRGDKLLWTPTFPPIIPSPSKIHFLPPSFPSDYYVGKLNGPVVEGNIPSRVERLRAWLFHLMRFGMTACEPDSELETERECSGLRPQDPILEFWYHDEYIYWAIEWGMSFINIDRSDSCLNRYVMATVEAYDGFTFLHNMRSRYLCAVSAAKPPWLEVYNKAKDAWLDAIQSELNRYIRERRDLIAKYPDPDPEVAGGYRLQIITDAIDQLMALWKLVKQTCPISETGHYSGTGDREGEWVTFNKHGISHRSEGSEDLATILTEPRQYFCQLASIQRRSFWSQHCDYSLLRNMWGYAAPVVDLEATLLRSDFAKIFFSESLACLCDEISVLIVSQIQKGRRSQPECRHPPPSDLPVELLRIVTKSYVERMKELPPAPKDWIVWVDWELPHPEDLIPSDQEADKKEEGPVDGAGYYGDKE